MAMAAPSGGMQINFDVAAARRFGAKLQHGAAKIRAGLVIPEAGMKNAHLSAVQGPQLIAPQPLMLPNLLQQSFGRRGFIRFPQRGRGQSERSSIKIGR